VHEEATRQAFRAAEESGIRAFIGKVMMDQNAPSDLLEDTRESLAASARLCEEWHGAADGRLGYVFSPRFAVTCSNALLSEVAALAEACGALIQTHLAENATELQTVAKLFPGARSYTDVYADAGLLGPRTIVAHCLYLSPREWDLLADTNTRIAHCPSSNFFLSSGIMDLHEALKRDIVVGLGSDVGAGPTLSMFAEMSQACFASRARSAMAKATAARIEALREDFVDLDGGEDLHAKAVEQLELADPDCLVSPAHALYMATLAGAETLGLRDQIGSFEPGKWADFVVVDLRQVDPYFGQEERAADEILSQIVFRTAPHAVAATYVAGDRRA
ncbi:MAG TPA: amidohydrolase family protein, partial [Armatimonadota bacterium]|nr:amidohydrolase family protein [Armatimonadota bacterium]